MADHMHDTKLWFIFGSALLAIVCQTVQEGEPKLIYLQQTYCGVHLTTRQPHSHSACRRCIHPRHSEISIWEEKSTLPKKLEYQI